MRDPKRKVEPGYKGWYESNVTCECGKVGFDKKGALTKRNSLLKLGNVRKLRVYPCPKSNLWHLTKSV